MKFDPYGALTNNHGNRILILFHLYCCSRHKLSTILIANVANLFRFVTLTDFDSKHNSSHFLHFISTYYFGYDWIITIMKDSKHVLSTINNKRVVPPTPHPPPSPALTATSPQQPLSPVPKVVVVETFYCSWKGCTKQKTSLL